MAARPAPLPEDEVDRIVDSIVGRERRKRTGKITVPQGTDEQREQLAVLLDLPAVDVDIRSVTTFGHGSKASVEIELSNGDTMTFDSIREMTTPAVLAAELAACAGVAPKIDRQRALKAVVIIRLLATRERAFSDNDIAVDWGAAYLQSAETIDLDFNDQGARWAAFSHMDQSDPYSKSRQEGIGFASATIVLRHLNGERYVRAGWFYQHVRAFETGIGQSALALRMLRVGWNRRGNFGRIKATAPSRNASLGWNFWTVPAGWEEDR